MPFLLFLNLIVPYVMILTGSILAKLLSLSEVV